MCLISQNHNLPVFGITGCKTSDHAHPKDSYRSERQKKQSNRIRSFWLAVMKENWMQMSPFGWPHTIQSLFIQIKVPLDLLYFHGSLQPRCLGFIPQQKQGWRTLCLGLTLASSSVHDFIPETQGTLDSSLGSSRNFRPQLCQLMVFVMFSISQCLLLTKMSRGYISAPPP